MSAFDPFFGTSGFGAFAPGLGGGFGGGFGGGGFDDPFAAMERAMDRAMNMGDFGDFTAPYGMITAGPGFGTDMTPRQQRRRQGRRGAAAGGRGGMGGVGVQAHPMDIIEATDSFVIFVDAPGVHPDDVNVELHEGVLTITVDRKRGPEKDVKGQVWRNERGDLRFTRSFNLPDTARSEGINAELSNGVLRVTVPKAETTGKQPQRITVQHGGGGAEAWGTTGTTGGATWGEGEEAGGQMGGGGGMSGMGGGQMGGGGGMGGGSMGGGGQMGGGGGMGGGSMGGGGGVGAGGQQMGGGGY